MAGGGGGGGIFKILEKLENFGFGGCLKLKYEVNIVQKYQIVHHHDK